MNFNIVAEGNTDFRVLRIVIESILEDARNRKNLTKDALAILEDIVETVA